MTYPQEVNKARSWILRAAHPACETATISPQPRSTKSHRAQLVCLINLPTPHNITLRLEQRYLIICRSREQVVAP